MIETVIKPETDLERLILNDPNFIEGVMWGEPRNGHPEGKVLYHIRDVLDNVDRYSVLENREKLRLIALIHDTFKYKVDVKKPKSGENHHALIARRFAENYVNDHEILEIIELHDEASNSYRKGSRDGKWIAAEERANRLISRLGNSITLFLIFYLCDNETGDKDNSDYKWFIDLL